MGDLKEQNANLQNNLEQQLTESDHLKVCPQRVGLLARGGLLDDYCSSVSPSCCTAPPGKHLVLLPQCYKLNLGVVARRC